ncbi:MAG: hypothetical protein FWE25_07375 [Lachnospiraceae bacterium]|nr:hypothetical protein [Lachnospiraceae bacterium]
MITSVYLSNNMIQIVRGDKTSRLPQVSGLIQEEILEGSILNGIITNEQELYEHLKDIWEKYKLPTKDVELVLNSAKIIAKNVVTPESNQKVLQKTASMEFTDAQQKEGVIYDYAPWNKGKEKGNIEILAVMVEESHLQTFVDLFKKLNIHLNRITFARTAIRNYLANVKELQKETNMILMVDGNALITILWGAGQLYYMDKKRLFVPVGSAGFMTEVLRSISNTKQLHGAQKIESPIRHVYTIGFLESDISACNQQLGEFGLSYEILPLPGKNADAIFAAGGLIRDKKDLNLLEGLKNKKKNDTAKGKTYGRFVPVLLIFVICLLASAGLFAFYYMQSNELAALQDFNQNATEAQTALQYDEISSEVRQMQVTVQGMSRMVDILATYPLVTSRVQDEILAKADHDIQIEFVSYSAETGSLDMTITVGRPEVIHDFINRLYETDLFWNVAYSGYTYDESTETYTIDVSCFLAETAGR